jgi:hypothetical protein
MDMICPQVTLSENSWFHYFAVFFLRLSLNAVELLKFVNSEEDDAGIKHDDT